MTTKVVNRYHLTTNWQQDTEYVDICRPTKWGNPFRIGAFQTREESLNKYREWLPRQKYLLSMLSELRGKTLVCVCKPKDCHGDVLAELVDVRAI